MTEQSNMKHKCPYCKIVFQCPIQNCEHNQDHFCLKICKDMSEVKKEFQNDIEGKLFPDGRCYDGIW